MKQPFVKMANFKGKLWSVISGNVQCLWYFLESCFNWLHETDRVWDSRRSCPHRHRHRQLAL